MAYVMSEEVRKQIEADAKEKKNKQNFPSRSRATKYAGIAATEQMQQEEKPAALLKTSSGDGNYKISDAVANRIRQDIQKKTDTGAAALGTSTGGFGKVDMTPYKTYHQPQTAGDKGTGRQMTKEYSQHRLDNEAYNLYVEYGDKSYTEIQAAIDAEVGTDYMSQYRKGVLTQIGKDNRTRDDITNDIAATDRELEIAQAEWDRIADEYVTTDGEGYTYYQEAQNRVNTLIERKQQLESELWTYDKGTQYGAMDGYSDFAKNSKPTGYVQGAGVYNYINNINGTADAVKESAVKNANGENLYAKYDYMTDEETARYNYLFNVAGKDTANEYLSYLDYYLNDRYQNAYYTDVREAAARDKGTAAVFSLMSVASNLTSGTGLIDVLGQKLARAVTGSDAPIDYNRAAQKGYTFAQAARDGSMSGMSEVGKFIYSSAMSMAESLGVLGAGLVIGPAASLLLSGSAATSMMQDAKEAGATDGQAIAMGIVAGAAEYFAEKVPLEELLNFKSASGAKAIFGQIFKQAGIEATEETLTTLANTAAEVLILGDKSSLAQSYKKYVDMGYSEKEAERLSKTDWLKGLALDAVGGLFSGALFAGGGTAITQGNTAVDRYKKGKAISTSEYTLSAIIEEVEQGDYSAETKQLAADIKADVAVGNTVGNVKKGKLADMIIKDNPQFEAEILPGITMKAQDREDAAEAEGKSTSEKTTSKTSFVEKLRSRLQQRKQVRAEKYALSPDAAKILAQEVVDSKSTYSDKTREAAQAVLNNETVNDADVKKLINGIKADNTDFADYIAEEMIAEASIAAQEIAEAETGTQTSEETKTAVPQSRAQQEEMKGDTASEQRTAETGTERGSTEGDTVRSDRRRGRFSDAYSGDGAPVGRESIRDVGRAEGRAQTADKRQSDVAALRIEFVSPVELGIKGGSENASMQIMPEETYDEELRSIADDAAKNGIKVTFFTGAMRVKGELQNALIEGSEMYIKADSIRYSASELYDHEKFHKIVRGKAKMLQALWNWIRENYTEESFGSIYDTYYEKYNKVYGLEKMSPDEAAVIVVEEILADAFAGTNKFGAGATEYTDVARAAAEEAGEAKPSEYNDNQGRGPPEGMTYDDVKNAVREVLAEVMGTESNKNTADDGSARFALAGRKSRTADIDALNRAIAMENDGEDSEIIFYETGWYRGADDLWRYEIDDSDMSYFRSGDAKFRISHPDYVKYEDLLAKMLSGTISDSEHTELVKLNEIWKNERTRLSERVDRGNATLSDILQHEALFNAYPELMNTRIVFEDMENGVRGSYDAKRNVITLSKELITSPESTLVHEIQHAIQAYEGFTNGASPEYWKKVLDKGEQIYSKGMQTALQALVEFEANPDNNMAIEVSKDMNRHLLNGEVERYDELNEWVQSAGFEDSVTEYEDLLFDFENEKYRMTNKLPSELYENTAGEMEARDVSARRSMSDDERRRTLPNVGNDDTVFARSSSINAAEVGEQLSNRPSQMYSISDDEYDTTKLNWAYENDIIDKRDGAAFWHTIANIQKRGYSIPISTSGEYIISSKRKLMFTDADYYAPTLTRVIVFGDNDGTDAESAKELIIGAETGKYDYREAERIIEIYYGEQYTVEYRYQDFETNGRRNGQQKGGNSRRSTSKTGKQRNNGIKTKFSISDDYDYDIAPEYRSWEDTANRKVNSYAYDHPELRPFYKEAARIMFSDLATSVKGERWAIYDDKGYKKGNMGTKRATTDNIARLLDNGHMTYKRIQEALLTIMYQTDNAKLMNRADVKKVELELDTMLQEGHTNQEGYEIEPNQEYRRLLDAIKDGYDSVEEADAARAADALVEDVDRQERKAADRRADAMYESAYQDPDIDSYADIPQEERDALGEIIDSADELRLQRLAEEKLRAVQELDEENEALRLRNQEYAEEANSYFDAYNREELEAEERRMAMIMNEAAAALNVDINGAPSDSAEHWESIEAQVREEKRRQLRENAVAKIDEVDAFMPDGVSEDEILAAQGKYKEQMAAQKEAEEAKYAGLTAEEVEAAKEAEARQRQQEYLEGAQKKNFVGSDSLKKLGIKIANSIADYNRSANLLKRAKANADLVRQMDKVIRKMHPSSEEIYFARGILNNDLNVHSIPYHIDAERVLELADYMMAQKAGRTDLLAAQKADINARNRQLAEEKFKNAEKAKRVSLVNLNYMTPRRAMITMFGQEQGEEIYRTFFAPVRTNDAERIRFAERLRTEALEIEGSDGKKGKLTKEERALAQMLMEGKAAAEMLAKMEAGDKARIEEAAAKILKGESVREENKKYVVGEEGGDELTDKEMDLARRSAAYSMARAAISTGKHNNKSVDGTRITNAAKHFAQQYDLLYDAINEFLVAHGEEPIGFIKGYAPHLQAEGAMQPLERLLQWMGAPSDITDLRAEIAGETHNRKPNRKWNPHFLSRNVGSETEYDVYKGFEEYVDYISEVFYHMDDIMRLRAASRYLRTAYTTEESRNLIKQIQEVRDSSYYDKMNFLLANNKIAKGETLIGAEVDAKLDKFIDEILSEDENKTAVSSSLVMWLDNYTNLLAGKQNAMDRGLEQQIGRKGIRAINKVVNNLISAQVVGNLSSALNQMAQLPMTLTELGASNVAKALWDMTRHWGEMRRWSTENDFLMARKGTTILNYQISDKITQGLAKPLEIADMLMSSITARAAYHQALAQGMDSELAMEYSVQKSEDIMGSRNKASKPVAFSTKNPLMRLVNAYQIEVLNQWQHIIKDLPQEYKNIAKSRGKGAAVRRIARDVVLYLVLAALINRIAEENYGGTPAPLDLLGIVGNYFASGNGLTLNEGIVRVINSMVGRELLPEDHTFDTERPDKFDHAAAWEDTLYTLSSEVPFLNNILAAAGLTDDKTVFAAGVTDAKESFKSAAENVGEKEYGEALYDVVMGISEFVVGGRQVQKTIQGIRTMVEHGSTNSKGQLMYPVANTVGNWIKATLFGKNALENSRAYYASGASPLSSKRNEQYFGMVDRGVDEEFAYMTVQQINAIESDKDEEGNTIDGSKFMKQMEYLMSLDVPDDVKDFLALSIAGDTAYERYVDRSLEDSGVDPADFMLGWAYYVGLKGTKENPMRAEKKASEVAKYLEQQGVSSDDIAIIVAALKKK